MIFYIILRSNNYQYETTGLQAAGKELDLGLMGDIMNVVGIMPLDVTKIVTMTPIKLIQGIADIVDPWWQKFPYTPMGAAAWLLENSRLPSWWEKEEGSGSGLATMSKSPCPDTVDTTKENFKKIGED